MEKRPIEVQSPSMCTTNRGGPRTLFLVGSGVTGHDQQVRIVHPQSRTFCPDDRVAEIWISGPSVAQEYWGREEETCDTFHATLVDTLEGPFLRTGDLGFLHDGELFVTGRFKDLIIIRGRNHMRMTLNERWKNVMQRSDLAGERSFL